MYHPVSVYFNTDVKFKVILAGNLEEACIMDGVAAYYLCHVKSIEIWAYTVKFCCVRWYFSITAQIAQIAQTILFKWAGQLGQLGQQ